MTPESLARKWCWFRWHGTRNGKRGPENCACIPIAAAVREAVEAEQTRHTDDLCYSLGWDKALEAAEKVVTFRIGEPSASRTRVDPIMDAVRDEEATIIAADIAALKGAARDG